MSTELSFRNPRLPQPLRWAAWAGLLVLGLARAEAAEPLFFIQLSDPQFGMCTANADVQQETANFEFAIATANRLKPAFVVVTGDLVNKAGDKTQVDEYLRIAAKLDRSIPLYQLPGNHDIGNEPTAESIAAYVARFGPDHYSFRCGPLMGLVLNSGLVQSAKSAPQEAEQQDAWLKAELEKAKQEGVRHVIVFQHHPWFIESIDEPAGYHNLPLSERRRYLDLFQQYGVTHVFAGHHHANATARVRFPGDRHHRGDWQAAAEQTSPDCGSSLSVIAASSTGSTTWARSRTGSTCRLRSKHRQRHPGSSR